jgi:hypothetical protein
MVFLKSLLRRIFRPLWRPVARRVSKLIDAKIEATGQEARRRRGQLKKELIAMRGDLATLTTEVVQLDERLSRMETQTQRFADGWDHHLPDFLNAYRAVRAYGIDLAKLKQESAREAVVLQANEARIAHLEESLAEVGQLERGHRGMQ